MKRTPVLLFIIILATNIFANAQNPSPHANEKIEVTAHPMDNVRPDEDPNFPKITIVLGGGGCKSLAEIGVLKVFAKNHIPIHYIVGTSAGAIIGALYASGMSLEEIEHLACDGELQKTLNLNLPLRILALPFINLISFGKLYAGLSSGKKLEKFLRKKLVCDFSELKIPFGAVATDIVSGNTTMITSGDLCKAIVASSAVPILIRPVTIGDTVYLDGGLKANLPTNCAKLTGADLIVAIPADEPLKTVKKKEFRSMRALTMRVTDIMEVEIDKHRWTEADLVIYPKVSDIPGITKDPEIVKRAVAAGEEAALEALPHLKDLINSKVSGKVNL